MRSTVWDHSLQRILLSSAVNRADFHANLNGTIFFTVDMVMVVLSFLFMDRDTFRTSGQPHD